MAIIEALVRVFQTQVSPFVRAKECENRLLDLFESKGLPRATIKLRVDYNTKTQETCLEADFSDVKDLEVLERVTTAILRSASVPEGSSLPHIFTAQQ